jgi:uncharacterized protein YcfJ
MASKSGVGDILAAGGTLAGGIIGNNAAQQGYADAKQKEQEFIDYIKSINPEAASAISQDPTVRNAQLRALTQMQDVANQGGEDVQSRVAERQAMDTANANERSQRAAIMADAAARGTVGGGQELASKLTAQQGQANRASATGGQAASDARTRALQAIQASGTQAGQIGQSDLSNQQAKNQIAEFNAAQRLNQGEATSPGYGKIADIAIAQGQAAQKADTSEGAGIGGILGGIGGSIFGGPVGSGIGSTVGKTIGGLFAGGGEVDEDAPAVNPEDARQALIRVNRMLKEQRDREIDAKAEEARRGADSINAQLPEILSARSPVKKHNAALQAAYDAAKGYAEGGEISLGKKKDVELPEMELPQIYRGENVQRDRPAKKSKNEPENEDADVRVATRKLAHGGSVDARRGGHVPGAPQVPGNSLRNDTVLGLLSPGEDVIDRETMAAPDAPVRAAKQVARVKALRRLQGRE